MELPPHHDPHGGFRNPWALEQAHGFAAAMRWLLRERLASRRPAVFDPANFRRATPSVAIPREAPGGISLTWVGHATFVIQIGAYNILTDPMWSDRASPVTFAGPRRCVPPSPGISELPAIDAVLMSHDHYDHFDTRSIRALASRFPEARWFAPLGVGRLLGRAGARHVSEHDWWDATASGPLRIGCTPARHFSGRTPAARNRTLWCGWTLEVDDRRVFFAGDTAWHPDFARIREQFGPFDLTLLPIGAYDPRWFMRPVHMDPEEAVQAFTALDGMGGGACMVGMHWGTFRLTVEPLDEPPRRTAAAWELAALPAERLWIMAHGETRRWRPVVSR
jgi:N-acyl-phosphatidylethanolamine-hydrolysing phospholipase D